MSVYHRARVEACLDHADSLAMYVLSCATFYVDDSVALFLLRSVVDRFVNHCCQDRESPEEEAVQDILNAVSKYKREKVCLVSLDLHILHVDVQCLCVCVCVRERELSCHFCVFLLYFRYADQVSRPCLHRG